MDPQVIGRYLPVYGRAVLVTVEVTPLHEMTSGKL